MRLADLAALNQARAGRRGAVLVTDIASGKQRLVLAEAIAADPLASILEAALRAGRSGMVESAEGRLFLTVEAPPPRILTIGAVHISQALAPMARLVGFDMTVIDPRTAFATPERFPDTTLLAEWPDEVLPRLGVDAFTAVVALTHDPKIDDPALLHALRGQPFYIGALGSRKTHGKRVERLLAAGIPAQRIGVIHAPIGLDIGAVSPAEIALSIMGEITQALRKGRGAAS